jgi:hypothetical protein
MVWFLGLFLDRSDRIDRWKEPIEPDLYFKFPTSADVF